MRTMQRWSRGRSVDFTIRKAHTRIPARGNRITQLTPKSGTLFTGAVQGKAAEGTICVSIIVSRHRPDGLLLIEL